MDEMEQVRVERQFVEPESLAEAEERHLWVLDQIARTNAELVALKADMAQRKIHPAARKRKHADLVLDLGEYTNEARRLKAFIKRGNIPIQAERRALTPKDPVFFDVCFAALRLLERLRDETDLDEDEKQLICVFSETLQTTQRRQQVEFDQRQALERAKERA